MVGAWDPYGIPSRDVLFPGFDGFFPDAATSPRIMSHL